MRKPNGTRVSPVVRVARVWTGARPLLLPWIPKRSNVLTSLIVPFGHKPGDLATRNLGQPPEPLGRTDEKRVQKRSFEFTLLPQCV